MTDSDPSDSAAVTMTRVATVGAPAAPSDLAATPVTDTVTSLPRIDLSWTDNSTAPDDATSFIVDRSTSSDFSTDLVSTVIAPNTESSPWITWNDTTVSADAAYFYRVRANDAAGDSDNADPVSASTILDAPSNLTAAADWSTPSVLKVKLNWNNNSSLADSSPRLVGSGGLEVDIPTIPPSSTQNRRDGINIPPNRGAGKTPRVRSSLLPGGGQASKARSSCSRRACSRNSGSSSIVRRAVDCSQTIVAIHNVTGRRQEAVVPVAVGGVDLLTGERIAGGPIDVQPYQFRWLTTGPPLTRVDDQAGSVGFSMLGPTDAGATDVWASGSPGVSPSGADNQ